MSIVWHKSIPSDPAQQLPKKAKRTVAEGDPDQGQDEASATIGMSPSRPQLALYFAEFLSKYLLSLRI